MQPIRYLITASEVIQETLMKWIWKERQNIAFPVGVVTHYSWKRYRKKKENHSSSTLFNYADFICLYGRSSTKKIVLKCNFPSFLEIEPSPPTTPPLLTYN